MAAAQHDGAPPAHERAEYGNASDQAWCAPKGRAVSDALVVFTPSGRRGRFARGTSVLDAARRLGVDLDSVCGGRGICGRCQATVAEGEHAKHGITCTAAALTPATTTELAYAADRGLAEGRRLGCTALVADDAVIDVPPESQVYRQVVRKEATRARSPSIRSSVSTTSRSRSRSWPRRGATSPGCSTRSSASGDCMISLSI